MKGTRNVRIVYGFGANVAFIMALLFATAWMAYSTRTLTAIRRHFPKANIQFSSPAPATSPVGRTVTDNSTTTGAPLG